VKVSRAYKKCVGNQAKQRNRPYSVALLFVARLQGQRFSSGGKTKFNNMAARRVNE
jgi:hypothetical protein